jgi:hypothetical protein
MSDDLFLGCSVSLNQILFRMRALETRTETSPGLPGGWGLVAFAGMDTILLVGSGFSYLSFT